MTDPLHRRAALRAVLGLSLGLAAAAAPRPAAAGIARRTSPSGVAILSVGVAGYQHLPPLRSSISDARALAAAFPMARTRQLVDPDRSTLLDGVQALAMEPAEWAVFIFAGHGVFRDGQSYLAARDADTGADGPLHGTVSGADIRARLAGAKARNLLLLIDACSGITDLVPTGRSGTVLALLAGAGDKPVSDGARGGNSPFTRTLLTALCNHRSLLNDGQPVPAALISTVQRLHSSSTQGISTILLKGDAGRA